MRPKSPNQYTLPTLPGTDPQSRRVMQDLVDQLNYLTGEVDRVRNSISAQAMVGAKKENPQPGIITIPAVNLDTQPGFIRVNPDGVIKSYTDANGTLLAPRNSQNLFTTTGIGAYSNSTTETSIFSLVTLTEGSTRTIEAFSSRPGTTYKCRTWGNFDLTGTPTIRIRVKLGSVTVVDIGPTTLTGFVSGRFWMDFDFHVQSVGSSGQVDCFPLFMQKQDGLTAMNFISAASAPSINWNQDNDIDLTYQWGTASASNTITIFGVTGEKIG